MKRKYMLLFILLMAIGFATVATSIFINGTTTIGANTSEFEIIFTKAILDNENKTNEIISGDKKTITFTTKDLKDIGDTSVLSYDVTNLSSIYDASVSIDVDVETNEYIRVTNEFDNTTNLVSRETRTGELTVELIKAATETQEFDLTVELVFSAVERTSVGNGELQNFGADIDNYSLNKDENTSLGRDWLWSTSYWTGTALNHYNLVAVYTSGSVSTSTTTYNGGLGVRPVVTISKNAVFTGEGTEESPYIITYRQ